MQLVAIALHPTARTVGMAAEIHIGCAGGQRPYLSANGCRRFHEVSASRIRVLPWAEGNRVATHSKPLIPLNFPCSRLWHSPQPS